MARRRLQARSPGRFFAPNRSARRRRSGMGGNRQPEAGRRLAGHRGLCGVLPAVPALLWQGTVGDHAGVAVLRGSGPGRVRLVSRTKVTSTPGSPCSRPPRDEELQPRQRLAGSGAAPHNRRRGPRQPAVGDRVQPPGSPSGPSAAPGSRQPQPVTSDRFRDDRMPCFSQGHFTRYVLPAAAARARGPCHRISGLRLRCTDYTRLQYDPNPRVAF